MLIGLVVAGAILCIVLLLVGVSSTVSYLRTSDSTSEPVLDTSASVSRLAAAVARESRSTAPVRRARPMAEPDATAPTEVRSWQEMAMRKREVSARLDSLMQRIDSAHPTAPAAPARLELVSARRSGDSSSRHPVAT